MACAASEAAKGVQDAYYLSYPNNLPRLIKETKDE